MLDADGDGGRRSPHDQPFHVIQERTEEAGSAQRSPGLTVTTDGKGERCRGNERDREGVCH